MFWKKSAKPSDLTISGKFHLGGPDESPSLASEVKTEGGQGGSPSFTPSNSDRASQEGAGVSLKESLQSSVPHLSLSGSPSTWSTENVLRRGAVARYVVPKGYKVTSSTFVQGLVRVEGELAGRGVAANAVEISACGVVSAPLEAGSLKIAGQLNAPADVRGCIEVLTSAVVSGQIVSAELVVEPGAKVASSRLQVG
jgi:cytoskeletal protein CcmA (bactofilin family)